MKREMLQISVEVKDDLIRIEQNDVLGGGEDSVIYIRPSNVETLCQWLREAGAEIEAVDEPKA